jgi:Tfp pilus assembly protein PilX
MHTQQTGSALAISLVLLTAITLISITSLQRTSLQTRIVANVQHSEAGFHAANSELEEMFQSYVEDVNAATILSDRIDKFTLLNGVKTYTPTDITGVTSTYHTNAQNDPHHVQISSNIRHTGQAPFTSGYSQGGFSTYGFDARTTARAPNNGRILSSQSMGIEFIGPAQN